MLRDCHVSAYAPVRDVGRAREFYEGVLQQQPKQVGEPGVLYECANNSTFFMYVSDGAGTSKASTLFWSVDDIEQEVAELRERGVTFETYDFPGVDMTNDIADFGDAKGAWFKDPDGNILALIQEG